MRTESAIVAALEMAPVSAYVFRADGAEFVLVSANAAARAGNPLLAALIGRPMGHLYKDQPELLDASRDALDQRTTVVRETSVRRHDRLQASQHVRLVFSFVAPNLLTVYSQDLSEPSEHAVVLRESEERFRSLLASLPDAFLMRDKNGVVLSCNQAAATLWGHRDPGELMGHTTALSPIRVESPDGRVVPVQERPSRRTMVTGVPELGLFQLVADDGSSRWVRKSAAPIRGPSGEIVGSTSIISDETDRVHAQSAVAASAAKLRLALDAASMGTFEWVPGLDRGDWSRSSTERFAIPHLPDVDPGLDGFLRCIHPEDRERVARINVELASTPDGTSFEHELRIVGDDGVTRWARLSGRVEVREHVRILGTVMDVTERRRLEEELKQAQRLESIGRLAGGLAHDFNNMLAAMLSSVELIEPYVAEAGLSDHQTLRHAAERARELTSQLLAFARKRPLQKVTFDLARLTRQIEPLLRRLVGPELELRIDAPGVVWVHGDAAQIEQCLMNLVANARDAGGPVDVRVRDTTDARGPADRAVLEVVDQGPGMDEATRARAFEPFFTTKPAGTGLGLASTYGVVRQHGGAIELESTPGAGTRIRVLLPTTVQVDAPIPEAPAVPARQTGAVLIIDDEPLVRHAARRLVTIIGFEAFAAGTLDEAEEIVNEKRESLVAIVCDLAMPKLSGPEVIEHLRKLAPELPVLFVSGYSEVELGSNIPRSAFLAKPYTREELAKGLRALIVA